MKLTLAITVYNRYELLLESFANVIDDDRIDEILVMDDHSEDRYWSKIKELPKFNPKIKVVRQLANRGMSVNKRDAIFHSKNEWVLLGDSDNVFGRDYLDAFYNLKHFYPGALYCPSFAKPSFDYREFEGQPFGKLNIAINYSNKLNCLLNTCNYIVNREQYLRVWKENKEMKGSDTIWFNYLWLKESDNNFIIVVPNMHYFHRVHEGSGFMQDADYNMKKAEEIKKLIMAL